LVEGLPDGWLGGFEVKAARPAQAVTVEEASSRQDGTSERRCPDQLNVPFALWTREAVQVLLFERFGMQVSIWSVGRYLKKVELHPSEAA
jgi:hypothetical protein